MTGDGKTLLKGGFGLFYDRVPLNVPVFPQFPGRTVLALDPTGQVLSSTTYANVISGGVRNPRSEAWNVELDRKVLNNLLVQPKIHSYVSASDHYPVSVTLTFE